MSKSPIVVRSPRIKTNLRAPKSSAYETDLPANQFITKFPHSLVGFVQNMLSTSDKRMNVAVVLTLVSGFSMMKTAAMLLRGQMPPQHTSMALSFFLLLLSLGAFLLWKKEKMPLITEGSFAIGIYYLCAIIAGIFPAMENLLLLLMWFIAYYVGPVIAILLVILMFGRKRKSSKENVEDLQEE